MIIYPTSYKFIFCLFVAIGFLIPGPGEDCARDLAVSTILYKHETPLAKIAKAV